MVYVRGSQPVAREPKVARQASKSGPRPLKESKEKYIWKFQKLTVLQDTGLLK